MTQQVSEYMHRSIGYRMGLLFLLTVVIGFFHGHIVAQQDSSPGITDLESYEELSEVKGSKTDHWYQIQYGDQWIGWARMQSRVLESYQGGGTDASNISVYKVSTQFSPQLVKEELRAKFRKQIREEREEGQSITSGELKSLVKERLTSRMNQLRKIVERRSTTTTIYRNQNNTIREARYGFSSDTASSFKLYLEPRQLGSGEFTALVPGEEPTDVEIAQERSVANEYLAAQVMADDSFQSEEYQFSFLDGTPKDPLTNVNVRAMSEETEELKIGEKSYDVRILHASFRSGGVERKAEKWWIDQDGIIRRVERLSAKTQQESEQEQAEEEGDGSEKPSTVTFTYSTREEARKGHDFVFVRRGRRNPFKPVWPKVKKEKEGPVGGGACQDYVAEDVLSRAKEIAFEQIKNVKEMDNKQQRINMQRSLIKEFNELKGRVMECGSSQDQDQVNNYEKRLQSQIDISQMVISIVDGIRQSTREAFDRRSFNRVASLTKEALAWEGELPSDTAKGDKKEFQDILQAIQTYDKRAKIRQKFRDNAPDVLGVVSSQDAREREVSMGASVFGDRTTTSITVNIPDVNSIAIIRSKEGDSSDRAKRPGEEVDVQGLSDVSVSEVHDDGVVFKYKGESIKVPLLKIKETVGKKD